MRHSLTLLTVSGLLFNSATGFFFGGGSGAACGCAQRPACPPPPPSNCGGARAVARGAKTMSFDQPIPAYPQVQSSSPRVYTVPDELDLVCLFTNCLGKKGQLELVKKNPWSLLLSADWQPLYLSLLCNPTSNWTRFSSQRAAAFGVPIVPQPQYSIFDILHNLGESGDSPAQQLVVADGSTNTDYFPKENDEDLTVSDMTGSGGLYRGKEIRRAPVEPTVHVHRDESVETTTISSESVKVDTDEKLDDNKCSSQILKKLMLEVCSFFECLLNFTTIQNMNDSSAESKRNINLAAEGKFGGNVDVICSRGHFSYIFTSNLYCEATQGLTTCIAFRQSDKSRRRR